MTRPSTGRRAYLWFVTRVLKFYFAAYHHLRVEGAEHIPPAGPVILILNHVSYLEPFAVGATVFDHGFVPGANTWIVAKVELFKNPLVGGFLSSVGMFPIDRAHFDRAAMRKFLEVLKAGDMIGMAPEGTRSPTGQLQEFQPVVAKIAISRRVPLLPVGAIGAHEALPVGTRVARPVQITLRFGPVFELSEFYGRALDEADQVRAASVMRQHIADLLPEWMRVPPPPEAVRDPGGVKIRHPQS